jgi:hypothetical protein
MIAVIVSSAEDTTIEVVSKAFERSFTKGQVRLTDIRARTDVVVVLGPTDADAEWLEQLASQRSKVILFGRLGPRIARLAGITLHPISTDLYDHCACPPTSPHRMSESSATLLYARTGLASSSFQYRSLCRFDFTDEWNNLGYGRIEMGANPWSIAVSARCTQAVALADVLTKEGTHWGTAASLRDFSTASILWFARPVGPVDGPDWRIIESFLADYRSNELPCRPYLRDIPHGVAAAVTMRLDCDEAIASVRPVFEFYRRRGLAVSVAVTTQFAGKAETEFLHELFAAGGAMLSHSASHPVNWGGSTAAAEAEALQSRAWLEDRFPGLSVRYAVSPFHQTPRFVPAALARAGYKGFVAGTIAGSPEYLVARGGVIPFGPPNFVSHSQSCMLHGDCLLLGSDPLAIYKNAFRNAQSSGQFFGYFDHPSSQRYSYGWASEAHRLRVHGDFLDFMQAECARVEAPLLFVNEASCLDFMLEKAATNIVFDVSRNGFSISRTCAAGLPLSVGFRGRIEAAENG